MQQGRSYGVELLGGAAVHRGMTKGKAPAFHLGFEIESEIWHTTSTPECLKGQQISAFD